MINKLNNSKMTLFNGPAGIGKNSAIEYAEWHLPASLFPTPARCKDKLHKITQQMFGVSESWYWKIYEDRKEKELPREEFSIPSHCIRKLTEHINTQYLEQTFAPMSDFIPLSIREAMIYVSEAVIKPNFGGSYFGRERAKALQEDKCYCDDSCGFIEELPPLVDRLGQKNILLLRIHREGYTFDGDSRNYIPDGFINNTVDIYNNGDENLYNISVTELMDKFYSGEKIDIKKIAIGGGDDDL